MSKPRDATFYALHLRFSKNSEDDVRAYNILQNQPQGKKKYILDAILSYNDSLTEKKADPMPAPQGECLNGNKIADAETIMVRLSDMESRIVTAIENSMCREPFPVTEQTELVASGKQSEVARGFNDDDVTNFQLARQAFGSLTEEDD